MQKNKDEEFVALLQAHKGIIYKVARSYSCNIEELDDLAQEIKLQLWKSYDSYDPTFKQSTWIYRIALNVAISLHRKKVVRAKHDSPFDETMLEIAKGDNKEEDAQLEQLMALIQGLEKINKALIILYLEGLSHKEISKILNISSSNVATKIQRIKTQLEQQMKEA